MIFCFLDRPLELPEFEILPNKSQVVFEGDKIPLICRASIINRETRMVWLRRGEVVSTNRSVGIFVITEETPDKSTMIHTLMLQHLTEEDSGVWQCMVTTPQGNVSTDITIVVISNTAATCPSKTSKTKKGVYKWPRTVAGVVSEQPCKRGRGAATHRCSESSMWEELNVDRCEYLEDLTRKLEAYALLKNVSYGNNQTSIVNYSTKYTDGQAFICRWVQLSERFHKQNLSETKPYAWFLWIKVSHLWGREFLLASKHSVRIYLNGCNKMMDHYCDIELCMEFVLFDINVNAMCQVDVLEVILFLSAGRISSLLSLQTLLIIKAIAAVKFY